MQTAEGRAGAVKGCLQRAAKGEDKERREIGVFASNGHGIVRLARSPQGARWLSQRADCGLRSTEGTPDAVLTG